MVNATTCCAVRGTFLFGARPKRAARFLKVCASIQTFCRRWLTVVLFHVWPASVSLKTASLFRRHVVTVTLLYCAICAIYLYLMERQSESKDRIFMQVLNVHNIQNRLHNLWHESTEPRKGHCGGGGWDPNFAISGSWINFSTSMCFRSRLTHFRFSWASGFVAFYKALTSYLNFWVQVQYMTRWIAPLLFKVTRKNINVATESLKGHSCQMYSSQ